MEKWRVSFVSILLEGGPLVGAWGRGDCEGAKEGVLLGRRWGILFSCLSNTALFLI